MRHQFDYRAPLPFSARRITGRLEQFREVLMQHPIGRTRLESALIYCGCSVERFWFGRALQILPRQPGSKIGAIVAPILGADGCIGALSAEINDGGEGSEAVQALSAIVAAHLASVLAVSTATSNAMPEPRAAAQG